MTKSNDIKAVIATVTEFECYLAITGTFAKKMKSYIFIDGIHGELSNTDYVVDLDLFVGNHHFLFSKPIDALAAL